MAAFQNGDSVSMYPFLALSGPRGSGKSYGVSPLVTPSMLLRTLYYYCRRNNWITLFVPSARIWTHQGRFLLPLPSRLSDHRDDASRGWFLRSAGALSEAAFRRWHSLPSFPQLHVTSGHLLRTLPLKCHYDRSLFWAKSQFGAVSIRRVCDVGDRQRRGGDDESGPAGAVRREQRA